MKRHLYHAICLLLFVAATYGFLAELKNSGVSLKNMDKVLHFFIFFTLTALLQWSYKPKLWAGLLIMASYGVLIEFLQQYFTRYRRAEFNDWLADLCGVVLFYLCYFAIRSWRKRTKPDEAA